jgi:hypothetical protein
MRRSPACFVQPTHVTSLKVAEVPAYRVRPAITKSAKAKQRSLVASDPRTPSSNSTRLNHMAHSYRQRCMDVRAMRCSTNRARSWICKRQQRGFRSCDQRLEAGREPPLGAHLVTPRHGYTHHGIYVGRGRVVQYGGLSRGLSRGPVEEVPVLRFSRGRPIWVRVGECGWKDRPEAASRAHSRLGEDRYHVLRNNCEHFCEWCVCGRHHSYQVDELIGRYTRTWRQLVAPLVRMVMRIDTNVRATS